MIVGPYKYVLSLHEATWYYYTNFDLYIVMVAFVVDIDHAAWLTDPKQQFLSIWKWETQDGNNDLHYTFIVYTDSYQNAVYLHSAYYNVAMYRYS